MGVGLNKGCDVQTGLSICPCLANSIHLGFSACSHIEMCGVYFFNFTCRVKDRVGSDALSAQQCKEPLYDPWVSQAQLGGDGKRRKET